MTGPNLKSSRTLSGWAGSATVSAIATGTLVAMYVIDLVGKLAEPIEPVRVLSAFRYYGSAIQHGIDVSHVVVLADAPHCQRTTSQSWTTTTGIVGRSSGRR